MVQDGFFDVENRLCALSKVGDPLETLENHINFETFRSKLEIYLSLGMNKSVGGGPAYDSVLMFKVLILQSLYNLSDDQTEYQIKDRLSFMRFLSLSLSGRVPDAKTIWLYRERLKPHIHKLFKHFDDQLKDKGYLAMGGQIVDASVVKAPRQRLSEDEKEQIKAGKGAEEIWENPSKARQKDTSAGWRVKQSKPKKPGHVALGIPEFGYKNHISSDRLYGFVREYQVTNTSRYDGHELPNIVTQNTCSKIWGDTAYSSQDNLDYLRDKGFTSHLHRRKTKGKNLRILQQENGKKSTIRSRVEHIFAHQKHHMHLFIRTIGICRAWAKIGFANLVYNMRRFVFFEKNRLITG